MRVIIAILSLSGALYCHAGDRLVIATATQGGSFSAFGLALKEALAVVDPELDIELLATRGSAENLPLLKSGMVDAGMVEGTLLHENSRNDGVPSLPVLTAMFPTPGMFAVRADSPYFRVADLRGQRIVFGAAGSGFVVLARYVLDGLGLDQNRDFDAVLLQSAKEGPPMVLNGTAAALWGGGQGWPAFEAVAAGSPGARFIGLTADEVTRVRERHPFLREMTVPANAYVGLHTPLPTVGSWSWLLARADLPEALAFRFARALHRAQVVLMQRFPAAQATIRATVDVLPEGSALHAGTTRYNREAGLLP